MNAWELKYLLTTDVVLFTHTYTVEGDARLSVVLIKRKNDPFKGYWALPGGFIDPNEAPLKAAYRELHEETNIAQVSVRTKLEFVNVYNALDRDPRGPVVSVAYSGYSDIKTLKMYARAADDAAELHIFPVKSLPPLAFDHKYIIEDAIHKTKGPGYESA